MANPDVTVSPNMSLPIPDTTDPGPDYANNVNAALLTVDGHTHTGAPTDGKQLDLSKQTCAGDVQLEGNNLGTVRSVELQDNLANLTGSQDVNCLCVVNNVLGFNNSSGTFVPITGSVGANLTNFTAITVTTNKVILPSDTYNVINCNNASATITVTLPVAAAITPTAAGRLYIIRDIGGAAETYNITIQVSGGSGNTFAPSGATSRTIAVPDGYVLLYTDGVATWYIWGQTDYAGGEWVLFGGTSQLTIGASASLPIKGAATVASGGSLTTASGSSLDVQGGTTVSLDAPLGSSTLTALALDVNGVALKVTSGTSTYTANDLAGCPILHFTGSLTGPAQITLPSIVGAVWIVDWSAIGLSGNTLNITVGSASPKALATSGTGQYYTTPAADSVNIVICTAANTFVMK